MSQSREIEVKYRVADLAGLDAALVARSLMPSPPVRQDDQAYAENGWLYGMDKRGAVFVHLRAQNGRHLFTPKRPTDNELARLEFETDVACQRTLETRDWRTSAFRPAEMRGPGRRTSGGAA